MTIKVSAEFSEIPRLESQCVGHLETFLKPESVTELMFSVNEAFTNVIRHGASRGQTIRVEIARKQVPGRADILVISVEDFGKGFRIRQVLPPYPDSIMGKGFVVSETIDGRVRATPETATALSIRFEPVEKSGPELKKVVDRLKFGGMGLSIICKLMDSVRYKSLENRNLLEMQKTIRKQDLKESK